MKVCIDAGHGGTDPGAVGVNKNKEAVINLNVALKVEKLLKEQGIEVIMTRATDKALELSDRVNISNKNDVDAFISIHCNASNGSGLGIETFSHLESTRDLADNLHKRLVDTKCYTKNRGVKHANYYVLRSTKARAALIELGFIDNKEDIKLLLDKQDEFALAIVKGTCDYLGVEYKEKTATAGELYYRVVVGSNKDRKLADSLLLEAKSRGFKDAFITTFIKE